MLDFEEKFKKLKGLIWYEEGLTLLNIASQYKGKGKILEIGSYIGKSSVCLAEGLRISGVKNEKVVCIDTFRGCPDLNLDNYRKNPNKTEDSAFDELLNFDDYEGHFVNQIKSNGLLDYVQWIKTDSRDFINLWNDKIEILFIDGYHTKEFIENDIKFIDYVIPGGTVCIHDYHNKYVDFTFQDIIDVVNKKLLSTDKLKNVYFIKSMLIGKI